jgi:hypothetical protein
VPDTVLGFTGNFQTDREVNGVRIKDKLHIFTGTYPLYYKGDGQLYIYPQYQPNVDQILRFGHNMLMDDFDERYRFNDTVEDLEVGESEIGTELAVKNVDYIPRFPYQGSPINLKVSYTRPPISGSVSRFLPESTTPIKYYEDFTEFDVNSLPLDTVIYVNTPVSGNIGFLKVVPGTQNLTIGAGQTIVQEDSIYRCPFDPNIYKVEIEESGGFEEIYGPNTISENVTSVCESQFTLFEYQDSLFRFFRITSNSNGTATLRNSTRKDVRIISEGKRLEVVPTPPLLQEFFVKVYERPAAGEFGFDASDWQEIENYTSTLVSNRASTFDNSLGAFEKEQNDNEVSGNFEPISYSDSVDVVIPGLQAIGSNRDLKVDVVLRTRGFRAIPLSIDEAPVYVEKVQFVDEEKVASTRIFDFPVLPEKIENYPNLDNPTRTFHLHAPWTANKVIEHFGKLIVYGSKTMPDNMFISAPEDVSLFYFPHLFRKEFLTDAKEPLESVIPFSSILVAQTANRTWGVKGNSSLVFLDEDARVENPNAYRVFDINTGIGTIAHKTVRPVRNQLYFLSNQGIMSLVSLYATDDKYNVRPLDRNINNIVPLDKEAIAIQHDNQYWISFPKTGEIFRYYIDQQAWMKDTFKNFEDFNGWLWMSNRDGVLRFLTRPMQINDGDSYRVFEGIVNKGLPTDFDKNITSEFLTANLDQDQPFHTKRYRELKMSFAVQNEYLPPLQPIQNTTSEVDNEYIVQFTGTRFHIYNLEFSLPFTQSMYEGNGRPDYFDLEDLEVVSARGENNEVLDWETNEDNTVDVFLGNYEGPVFLTLKDNDGNIIQDTDVVVTDVTYDFNIRGSVVADSDGQIINRVNFQQYEMIEGEIVTADNLPVVQSLGTRFRVFELGDTPFGDIKRNVQTVRLAGTGYQIALYLKDESRTKWTLESLGLSFRMRKTRSR